MEEEKEIQKGDTVIIVDDSKLKTKRTRGKLFRVNQLISNIATIVEWSDRGDRLRLEVPVGILRKDKLM